MKYINVIRKSMLLKMYNSSRQYSNYLNIFKYILLYELSSISMWNITIYTKTIIKLIYIDNINKRKYFKFLIPTQLLIQGQWWSYNETHLLHIKQCLDRDFFIE